MRVPLSTPSCAASSVLSRTGSFSALLTSAGTPHGSAIAQSYSSALERYKLELATLCALWFTKERPCRRKLGEEGDQLRTPEWFLQVQTEEKILISLNPGMHFPDSCSLLVGGPADVPGTSSSPPYSLAVLWDAQQDALSLSYEAAGPACMASCHLAQISPPNSYVLPCQQPALWRDPPVYSADIFAHRRMSRTTCASPQCGRCSRLVCWVPEDSRHVQIDPRSPGREQVKR